MVRRRPLYGKTSAPTAFVTIPVGDTIDPDCVEPPLIEQLGAGVELGGLSSKTLQLKTVRQSETVEVVDRTTEVQLRHRGAGLTFSSDLTNWARNWSHKGRWRCGGFDAPANPPHVVHDYPFQTVALLDYTERPNYLLQCLESSLSTGANSGYYGCEDGEYIEASLMTQDRRLRWGGRFLCMNATHDDTFIEFVVEPNHVVGTLDGPDRFRFTTDELGICWSGYERGEYQLEITSRGTYFELGGWVRIGNLYEYHFGGSLTPTDWDPITDDAVFSQRFRIDRIANIDTYDGTYQVNSGTDRDATERELDVRFAWFQGA